MDNLECKSCYTCGLILTDEQQFCPSCGSKRDSESYYCFRCGTKHDKDSIICPNCGEDIVPKSNTGSFGKKCILKRKNNVLYLIIIAGILFGILIGCLKGYNYYTTQKEINLIKDLISNNKFSAAIEECNTYLGKNDNDKIKELLKDAKYKNKKIFMAASILFDTDIIDSGIKIESIANEVDKNWKSYADDYSSQFNSIEEAVSGALEKKETEVGELKKLEEEISENYNLLIGVSYDDTEMSEIKNATKDLYEVYKEFYAYVMSPYGDYEDFYTRFHSLDQEFAIKYKKMHDLGYRASKGFF